MDAWKAIKDDKIDSSSSSQNSFAPFDLYCTYCTLSQSKIVVTGVPTKSYRLPSEWIQPNTTVVNVASFKNVDEESLLKIDGVTYVPMVGKVTVAMLERNLMRLYYNFHHPDRRVKLIGQAKQEEGNQSVGEEKIANQSVASPWYGSIVQVYTACVATAVLAVLLSRK
jgi:hypothetical protein